MRDYMRGYMKKKRKDDAGICQHRLCNDQGTYSDGLPYLLCDVHRAPFIQ